MSSKENITIYRNTIVVYLRMIIVTVIGIVSSRFVLQALGASDYGLYNIVGCLIVILNFLSTAMSTTTRRYLNVEMGKPDGNLNRVFNICFVLQVGFAILIFLIAETVGIWYINNILNVAPGKELDAMFIFQISTMAACLGVINIPYQSLIEAYEQFYKSAVIDIISTVLKIVLIFLLFFYSGNVLRFYAISMCVVTLSSLLLYMLVCEIQWKDVIKFRFYKSSSLYKEILGFNNYTALGALAYIGRTQGTNLLVNYFFGTIVNAAFAISYQIESYVYMFVSRLTIASNPQIAKYYEGTRHERSIMLVEKNSKYVLLIMIAMFSILSVDIDFILSIWLKDVPNGTALLCVLTLLYSLVLSLSEGMNGYVQASGKIKWFQIVTSSLMLINLPIGYILFKIGYSPHTIVVSFIITAIISRIITLVLMHVLLRYDVKRFIKQAYMRPFIVLSILLCISALYQFLKLSQVCEHMGALGVYSVIVICIIYAIGLDSDERCMFKNMILRIVKIKC